MAKKNQTAKIAASDRPECSLGLKPEITNEDQANEALLFLSFMNGHVATVGADADLKVKAIKDKAKRKLFVVIDGEQVSYLDRAKQLSEALTAYAKAEQPQLKSNNGKKSVDLTHGTIGWRKSPDRIEYIDGKSDSDVIAAVDKATNEPGKGGIIELLEKLLNTVLLFFDDEKERKLSLLFTVQLKLQKDKAKEAIDNKQLKKSELRKFKLKYVAGKDEFVCKPNQFTPLKPR